MSVVTACHEISFGWEQRDITYAHRNGKTDTQVQVIDLKRYNDDHKFLIAFKCAALFALVIPLYFSIYSTFQLLRLPIVTVFNLSPVAFCKQIWAIVRIPFYLIALELAAFQGVFKPMEGRALFSAIERDLHDGKSTQEVVCFDGLTLCGIWNGLSAVYPREAFFVAPCMQPIGKINDPHIRAILPQGSPSQGSLVS